MPLYACSSFSHHIKFIYIADLNAFSTNGIEIKATHKPIFKIAFTI